MHALRTGNRLSQHLVHFKCNLQSARARKYSETNVLQFVAAQRGATG